MKKYIFLIVPVFLLISHKSFAQNITTGNQSAETHVTNINNNGSVTSHVETTVNGQTTTIDSNQPGELDVKNVNGNVTVTKIPNPTIMQIKTATISPTINPTIKPLLHKQSFAAGFLQYLKDFFNRLIHNL